MGTRLLRFRDTHWLKRCVAQHGNQGHVGRFRVWRWEQSISKFCGTLWQDKARDKEAWEETAKAGGKVEEVRAELMLCFLQQFW